MILVVDDHADFRTALLALLRLDGYEACGVGSGAEALSHLESYRPHCILLDYNMPDVDGIQVTKAVRADPRFNEVRIIMFTAQDSVETDARAAGVDGFILKASLDWAKVSALLKRFCQPSGTPLSPAAPAKASDKRIG